MLSNLIRWGRSVAGLSCSEVDLADGFALLVAEKDKCSRACSLTSRKTLVQMVGRSSSFNLFQTMPRMTHVSSTRFCSSRNMFTRSAFFDAVSFGLILDQVEILLGSSAWMIRLDSWILPSRIRMQACRKPLTT